MRAPKHLWSGDWERESAAVADELASLEELPRVVPEPAPESPRPEPGDRAGWSGRVPRVRRVPRVPRLPRLRAPSPRARRASALAVALMLVLAAAGYGLATLLSSTSVGDVPAAAGKP